MSQSGQTCATWSCIVWFVTLIDWHPELGVWFHHWFCTSNSSYTNWFLHSLHILLSSWLQIQWGSLLGDQTGCLHFVLWFSCGWRTREKKTHNNSEMKITSFMFPQRMQFQIACYSKPIAPPKNFFISNTTFVLEIYGNNKMQRETIWNFNRC